MADPFIVSEISKNWSGGAEVAPERGPLCKQFEMVINHNAGRGYRLMTFQIHRFMVGPGTFNETIIAVFEKLQ